MSENQLAAGSRATSRSRHVNPAAGNRQRLGSHISLLPLRSSQQEASQNHVLSFGRDSKPRNAPEGEQRSIREPRRPRRPRPQLKKVASGVQEGGAGIGLLTRGWRRSPCRRVRRSTGSWGRGARSALHRGTASDRLGPKAGSRHELFNRSRGEQLWRRLWVRSED